MTLLSLPRVRPVGGVPDNRFPGDPAASGSPPLGSDPGEKVAAVTVEHFENFLAVSARVTPGSPSLASSNVLVQCSVTPACLSACFKPQESSLFNTLLILPVCACSKSYTHKYSSSTFVCSKKNPSVWWLLYCPACYKKNSSELTFALAAQLTDQPFSPGLLWDAAALSESAPIGSVRSYENTNFSLRKSSTYHLYIKFIS